ncbi:unnamed protein product [Enterobius vermicularis]|uniref:LIM/homeobox protein Lhx9 n=1 Tax=Enterobius vermicularis TaxID=51028 RepID=A0A0N4VAP6_ENTVE|nr:unnamed protein product [Enterobius vermicularis]
MLYLKTLDDNLNAVSSQLNKSVEILNSTNKCASCLQPILDQYFLMIADRSWHTGCLRCCLCQRPLSTSPSCFLKDGLVFCRQDYTTCVICHTYMKRCERCSVVLCCDDLVMRARDAIFHLRCFTCIVCDVQLRPGQMFAMADNGTLYCQDHYGPVSSTNSQLPSMKIEASEERYKRKKQRCKKSKKLSEDGENVSDHLEFCEEENQIQTHKSKRMRTSFKHHQLRTMKSYFNLNHNPDAKDLKQLAQRTGLTKRVLQVRIDNSLILFVWFQNARAKFRRNTMQSRDMIMITPSSTQSPSIASNNDKIYIESKVKSLTETSRKSSLSPDEVKKKNVAFCDTTNSIDNSDIIINALKLEDGCDDQTEKSLTEYFDADTTLL